ncbi:hypothetical protein CORC01_12541 [Colletotrichum orchidophilum]|uniref:Uncharacterized protein n=1 Tax=Colletotrichum orchidophilum TaxID=1209926 RepID=A0A1G4ASJ8_9PEZI|nr:uncharacterized protein CORC01_12541 [Colletotrichum orchidophilum]OHE92138.1 hypothetical protein CORC01_12541 [Colletotrichum orchidophilum]
MTRFDTSRDHSQSSQHHGSQFRVQLSSPFPPEPETFHKRHGTDRHSYHEKQQPGATERDECQRLVPKRRLEQEYPKGERQILKVSGVLEVSLIGVEPFHNGHYITQSRNNFPMAARPGICALQPGKERGLLGY